MNPKKRKALEDAERAFNATLPGSEQEKVLLQKWRGLCETEREEQVPISAYLRRKRQTEAQKKKSFRRKNR